MDRRSGWRAADRGARKAKSAISPGVSALLILPLLFCAVPSLAQEPGNVRVFLDCQTRGCDSQEFRTEIDFVDWVREPAAADVHVILTRQDAGPASQFVFDFVGRGEMEGVDTRLPQDIPSIATNDERLALLVRAFRAGLVPYVLRRGYAHRLEISGRPASASESRDVPVDDPWNQWVFTLRADGAAEGEEREETWRLSTSVNANRTTVGWKLEGRLNGRFYRREVELNDGEIFVYDTDDWDVGVLAVRSLSPHWSAGSIAEASSSTERNRRIGGRTALAVEWDLYPYAEANRRQLLVHYQVGVSHIVYEDTTIFDRLEETLYDHSLTAVYDNRQPWGEAEVAVHYSNYLQDFSKHRLATRAGLSVRLFRGFNVNLSARYERIRDQLYLSKEELSNEDILVQRRQLATGYEYGFDVGLSYRFGSIYNNVVNNRFPWDVRRFR
ncbi:MAG TPA: hypothetical protein VMM83_03095 [Longimicrobiales bacterium]|nr:hypothetical protein [Longimicrobiales bacterium]